VVVAAPAEEAAPAAQEAPVERAVERVPAAPRPDHGAGHDRLLAPTGGRDARPHASGRRLLEGERPRAEPHLRPGRRPRAREHLIEPAARDAEGRRRQPEGDGPAAREVDRSALDRLRLGRDAGERVEADEAAARAAREELAADLAP